MPDQVDTPTLRSRAVAIGLLEALLKRWEGFFYASIPYEGPWYVPEELLNDTNAALRPEKAAS